MLGCVWAIRLPVRQQNLNTIKRTLNLQTNAPEMFTRAGGTLRCSFATLRPRVQGLGFGAEGAGFRFLGFRAS